MIVTSDSGQTVFSLEHLEICLKEAEEKARALLEQLTASEATKSQLLEKVSMLEGRLEDVNRKNVGGELYENMVLEKDKCIEKLQAEVKASQEKLNIHQPTQWKYSPEVSHLWKKATGSFP